MRVWRRRRTRPRRRRGARRAMARASQVWIEAEEERVHLFEAEERAAMRAEERTRRGEDAGTREDAGDAFGGAGVGRNAVEALVRARAVGGRGGAKYIASARARRRGRRRRRFARRRDASGWRAPTAAHPSASREGPIGAKEGEKARKTRERRRDAKDDDGDEIYRLRRERLSARKRRAEQRQRRFWRGGAASSIGITGARARR